MKRLALVAVLLAAAACAQPRAELERPVVHIEGSIMTRAELDAYLQFNLAVEDRGAPLVDVVGSRLLDTWIDERLILTEAQDRELSLSDETVDDLLDDPAYESGEGDLESRRNYLRERLMIQFLQGQVLQDITMPSTAEASEWLSAHAVNAGDGKKVELRSLRFDDADKAQQVHRNLRRNRLTFNEAVVQNSDDESQGEPTVVEWGKLPVEVQQAIEKLRPHWTSVPVEAAGSTYLFYIVAWIYPDPDARLEAARTERYSAARRGAWKDFVNSLRQGADIEIVSKNLPFSYIPDTTD